MLKATENWLAQVDRVDSRRSQTARIIGEFCEHLKQIGVDVQQVILFGSHVRDEAHEDSDIDLLIVSSDFASLEDLERRRLLSRARMNLWQPIHAYPVSPEELERVEPATLLEEILATGRRVGITSARKVAVAREQTGRDKMTAECP